MILITDLLESCEDIVGRYVRLSRANVELIHARGLKVAIGEAEKVVSRRGASPVVLLLDIFRVRQEFEAIRSLAPRLTALCQAEEFDLIVVCREGQWEELQRLGMTGAKSWLVRDFESRLGKILPVQGVDASIYCKGCTRGRIVFDPVTRTLWPGTQRRGVLTQGESSFLEPLLKRGFINKKVFSEQKEADVNLEAVEKIKERVKKRLGRRFSQCIETQWGFGYRLECFSSAKSVRSLSGAEGKK